MSPSETLRAKAAAGTGAQLIWDLPLRVFHWLLALAVLGAWVTYKLGTQAFGWHCWFGYACLVLVGFRLAWGFVGPRYARFANFLRGPGAAWRYARDWLSPRSIAHLGHNPLGGWMVMVLLALVAAEGVTGLYANDEIFNTGPLYGYVSDAASDRLSGWHRLLADALWYAIGLHVIAVSAYYVLRGENLVGPMITGRKSGTWLPANAGITGSRVLLALALAAACALALFALVASAPEPSLILF
ncbi:MAG TPA: cytochrome b/b6 domain-containing protein [Steroidobacteraceae bacterium]|jgi:cytochrome b|nr:cytochrome b/b6 domain-containing protein [Steroidobacteraceae bacterium]